MELAGRMHTKKCLRGPQKRVKSAFISQNTAILTIIWEFRWWRGPRVWDPWNSPTFLFTLVALIPFCRLWKICIWSSLHSFWASMNLHFTGWKNPNPPPNPPRPDAPNPTASAQDPCRTCTHPLSDHVSHLQQPVRFWWSLFYSLFEQCDQVFVGKMLKFVIVKL